jgi:hypothetical protein
MSNFGIKKLPSLLWQKRKHGKTIPFKWEIAFMIQLPLFLIRSIPCSSCRGEALLPSARCSLNISRCSVLRRSRGRGFFIPNLRCRFIFIHFLLSMSKWWIGQSDFSEYIKTHFSEKFLDFFNALLEFFENDWNFFKLPGSILECYLFFRK